MTTITVNKTKNKNLSREELLELTKEELVDTIIQMQTYNKQLKNIISKNTNRELQKCNKKSKPFDFTKRTKRRILLRIAYFGWNYQGLVVQEDSNESIEDHLFSALIKGCLIESRETSNYHRCGRTDKGVSASGQIISIEVTSKLPKDQQNDPNLIPNELPYCKILNRLMPPDIKAVCWLPLSDAEPIFSARFNCKQRTYKYWFPVGDLDIDSMRSACKLFLGSHDFRNICKMDVGNGVTSFIRYVHSIDIVSDENKSDDSGYNMCCLIVSASSFLWHQIRCIVAILLMIGKKLESPSIVTELLDVENNPRKPQYNMAIELPLNLYHCSYDILKDYDQSIPEINQGEDHTMPKMQSWWNVDRENLDLVIKSFQSQWTKAAIQCTMIKDVIDDLISLSNSNGAKVYKYQSDNLLQGVKSKVYVPLLKRNTCESLENRINHYMKKKRLKVSDEMES